MEQILDESDAVGLMQLQCKEAKDDASAMIFPTTDTLPLQKKVGYSVAVQRIEAERQRYSRSTGVAQ